MKRSVVIASAALLLIVAAVVTVAFRSPGPAKVSVADITGTWQLDSYKYGSTPGSFTRITPERPHIKLITGDHFLWATYDAGTKKILESAGGKYTLEGDSYTEYIDFGFNMDTYLGTRSVFTIKVEGGVFFLSGVLSDGYKIEEIWLKIK